jgi:hypothetical protein
VRNKKPISVAADRLILLGLDGVLEHFPLTRTQPVRPAHEPATPTAVRALVKGIHISLYTKAKLSASASSF